MLASYISAYHSMAQDKMLSRSLYNLQISLSDNPEKNDDGVHLGQGGNVSKPPSRGVKHCGFSMVS